MFHGSMVAIVTPMTADGSIDERSLCELVEMHILAGTTAIIAVGTTGESATLNKEETLRVIELIIKQVANRIPVIAGTGTNCTAKTITMTQAAMELGADACLIVTPYYNKPTQEGLFQHYKTVAENVAIPIILYNVPSRTAVDMSAETTARLAKIPNIVGIKETATVDRVGRILELCDGDLDIYSGDDINALSYMLAGAKGVISVVANIAPRLMQEMSQAALNGDVELAESLNDKLLGLHVKLFLETNPIPTKWALNRLGLIPPGLRLPLTPLAPQFHADVISAMQQADISV